MVDFSRKKVSLIVEAMAHRQRPRRARETGATETARCACPTCARRSPSQSGCPSSDARVGPSPSPR